MRKSSRSPSTSARLVITERAVQKHAISIFRKLGLAKSSDDHRRVLVVLTFLNA